MILLENVHPQEALAEEIGSILPKLPLLKPAPMYKV